MYQSLEAQSERIEGHYQTLELDKCGRRDVKPGNCVVGAILTQEKVGSGSGDRQR